MWMDLKIVLVLEFDWNYERNGGCWINEGIKMWETWGVLQLDN